MILKAKTHKGKNRIAQWGNEWVAVEETGNKFLIVSVKEVRTPGEWPDSIRWVEKENDPDFEIVG